MRKSDYKLEIRKSYVDSKWNTLGFLREVIESERIPFSSYHADDMREEIDHMLSVGAIEIMQHAVKYMHNLCSCIDCDIPSGYRDEMIHMLHDIEHVRFDLTDVVRTIEFDDDKMTIAPVGIKTRFADYVGNIIKISGNGTSQKTIGVRIVIGDTIYDIATKDNEISYKTINFPLIKRKYIEPTITSVAHSQARSQYITTGNATDITLRLRRVASGAME